tara:strand:+ start:337 stop:744 length:408 start_codon:yes stop_codon:yes gene_type:complete
MNDNVFELKPVPEKTFKSLLRDNASDLWDVAEECIVAPSGILEDELLEVLCGPDNGTFINEALWIGGDSGDFEQLLMAFIQQHPHHPLSIHVDKSLRGYLELVIEKEEATIAEANAAEEESYRQEYYYCNDWEPE